MKSLYTLCAITTGLSLSLVASEKPNTLQSSNKPTTVISEEKNTQESSVKELNSKAELDKALKESGVTIIKVSAPWCGPCKTIKPTIEGLANKYKDKVKTYTINADNKEFAGFQKEHNIMGLPTIICLPSGRSIRGAQSVSEYETFFAAAAKEVASATPAPVTKK